MIKITYEIDGKKIKPEQLANEMEKAMLIEVGENIKTKLTAVVCKKHHKRPIVNIVGKSSSSINFEIEGCCQQLIDKATTMLQR